MNSVLTPRADASILLTLALLMALAAALHAEQPATSELPISPAVLERQWTGRWLTCEGADDCGLGVFRFRKVLELAAAPERFVVHVSADNRFILYVNGTRVGAGPARGDKYFWRFETFDLAPYLNAGRNLVVAVVWSFGAQAPSAQISRGTGFVMQGDDSQTQVVNTDASWQCAPEPGHAVWPEGLRQLREESRQYYVAGPGELLDAALYEWGWLEVPRDGEPTGRWSPAVASGAPSPRSIAEGPGWARSPEGRLLVPDKLPQMAYRTTSAGEVVRSSGATLAAGFPAAAPATVDAHTHAMILLDRRRLVAAYPELVVSGGRGAMLTLTYQEALVGDGFAKGNRDQLEGKRMLGLQDRVLPDGGEHRVFQPLWWRTWRYLQLEVETAAEPLTIDGIRAFATGYPFAERARFDAGDATLERIWNVGWRTARLCAHETYVDCPYYEQLQYVGDTRLQALISYTVAGDDRLARQAIAAFERSRRSDGLTSSRYPAAEPQYIPPFSLLWIGMVHDFWRYRDDPAFVSAQLPGTRTVLEWFIAHQREDGLLGPLPWWTFLDWAADFPAGVPPLEADGGSAPLTLQLVDALREAAELEEALGQQHRARSYRERADRSARAVLEHCWSEERGLLADVPSKNHYSQHTNILGILADALPAEQAEKVLEKVLAAGTVSLGDGARGNAVLAREGMTKASYYFRFYLARALDKLGRGEQYLTQLTPWKEMLDLGLSTWAESPDDSVRSDCHAWSAHPTYDLLTIVAGIKPAAPGFARVLVEPALGELQHVEAAMPHPLGMIRVAYQRAGKSLEASVELPAGLEGELVWDGHRRTLIPGEQSFLLE